MTLAELRRIAEAATQGRWQWYGNTKQHEVYLATTDRGRIFVMDFARWGMSGAQPRFQVRLNGDPGSGIMRSIGELGAEENALGPTFEVPYRRHFTGIGHPDARHIATFHPDAVLRLLAVVEAAVRWADSETACAETLSGTATAERRTIASVHWKTLDALRAAIDNLERK